MIANKKVALVIGAQGGIGKATAALLCERGWYVIAADVQFEEGYAPSINETVEQIQIDITNDSSAKAAFDRISQRTGGLDAVIHAAGILQIGSMVELPIDKLQQALDINLLGVYRINQIFLPLILKRRGRIIHLSSEVGTQTAAPFNGMYSITKHALEAYSDALRRELMFLGIEVIKIQPGPIKTSMTKSGEDLFAEAERNSVHFKKQLNKGRSYLPSVYRDAHEPMVVAEIVLKALESKSPRIAYRVVQDTTRRLLDLLPDKWSDKLIKYFLS